MNNVYKNGGKVKRIQTQDRIQTIKKQPPELIKYIRTLLKLRQKNDTDK